MRIDQSIPSVEPAQTERATGASGQTNSAAKSSQAQPQPEVSLHDTGLHDQVANVPDIRQDRVAALQKAMQDGTYHVSNEDLAGAIFNALVQKK